MRNSSRMMCFCLAVASLSFAPTGRAQQNPPAPQQGAAVRTTSEEVLLDVVVRDKKGHPVNNLKPDDFQVFDNGEQKKIIAFRLVEGGEAVIEGGARTQLDPLRQIRLVTMIFQCGSNDARRLAHDAAMGLVKGELGQNVYMAVMTIDRKLEVIQSFTNDPALLRKAIDRANRSENTDFSADTAMVQKQLEQMLGPDTNGAQSTQGQIDNQNATISAQAQGRAPDGAGMANMAMAQMVLQMLVSDQSNAGNQDRPGKSL